jgi:hypothetical protein
MRERKKLRERKKGKVCIINMHPPTHTNTDER